MTVHKKKFKFFFKGIFQINTNMEMYFYIL